MVYTKLPRSPLVLVVAQIRFSPVENIEKEFIPVVQGKLRTLGFPYFSKSVQHQISVTPTGLQNVPMEQWNFTDKIRKSSVILQKSSLLISTTAYSTFVDYTEQIRHWIENISKILDLQYNVIEQIGLRYVDWIFSIDGKSPEELINNEYLGGFTDEKHEIIKRQAVIEKKTDSGVVRTILYKPSEQEKESIKADFPIFGLNSPVDSIKELPVVLDMDHIGILKKDYSDVLVLSTLQSLHDEQDKLFYEQIPTPEAIKLWGKEGEY
jgi:uncharacterized protein (TIGR04255 family)